MGGGNRVVDGRSVDGGEELSSSCASLSVSSGDGDNVPSSISGDDNDGTFPCMVVVLFWMGVVGSK